MTKKGSTRRKRKRAGAKGRKVEHSEKAAAEITSAGPVLTAAASRGADETSAVVPSGAGAGASGEDIRGSALCACDSACEPARAHKLACMHAVCAR